MGLGATVGAIVGTGLAVGLGVTVGAIVGTGLAVGFGVTVGAIVGIGLAVGLAFPPELVFPVGVGLFTEAGGVEAVPSSGDVVPAGEEISKASVLTYATRPL